MRFYVLASLINRPFKKQFNCLQYEIQDPSDFFIAGRTTWPNGGIKGGWILTVKLKDSQCTTHANFPSTFETKGSSWIYNFIGNFQTITQHHWRRVVGETYSCIYIQVTAFGCFMIYDSSGNVNAFQPARPPSPHSPHSIRRVVTCDFRVIA